MGHIYLRGRTWYGDYRDVNGIRHRESLRTRDKDVALRRVRQAELDMDEALGVVTYTPPNPGKWMFNFYGVPVPCVYFILGDQTSLIKIGTSRDLQSRFAALRDSSPDRLLVLGAMPGRPEDELRIHRSLRDHRRHGEWFASSDDVLDAAKRFITWKGPHYDELWNFEPSEGKAA